MSDLGSVINGMLNGLAYARFQSDLTTKLLAEQYQKDPLLSLFPVPRMDFHSVEADISLVLNEVVQNEMPSQPTVPAPTIPTPIPPGKLPPAGETPPIIELPAEESLKFQTVADDHVDQLAASLLNKITNQLSLSTSKRSNTGKALPTLHKMIVEEIRKFEAQSVRNALNVQQPLILKPQSDLRVGVTPSEIEKATPAALGRIKLQMGVQNYEWIEVDRNESGGSIKKLTPTGR